MDWSTLMSGIAMLAFLSVMIRGCGMGARGCGEPKRRSSGDTSPGNDTSQQ
jgi:hypothetical protein